MWMRGYANQSSTNFTTTTTTTIPADNNSNGCGAIDQYGNPMSMMMMPLPADPSFNGRRLRPLIPKPSTCTTNNPTLPPCFNHGSCDNTNNNEFFPINNHITTSQYHHHLMGAVVDQQGSRRRDQFNGSQSVVVSSRWNPTPEQLRALEELYRRGTRTPSAVQIQHITSQLRRYGKIEGKNVFYWFQNHKARERQKRRRQQLENSSSSPNDQQQSLDLHHDHQTKEPAPGDEGNHNDNKGNTTGFEIEQTKAWTVNINCSTLPDQESVHKPEKAAAECVTDDEWVQFQDHHNSMQIAYSSTIMFQDSVEEQHRRRRTRLSQLAKSCNTTWEDDNYQHHQPPTSSYSKPTTMVNEPSEFDHQDHGHGINNEGALTLELFPLRSSVAMDLMKDDDDIEDKETHLTSYQFFEFLPLKNSTAY